MLCLGLAVHQNVVQEHHNERVQEGLENAVHEGHESGRSVGQAKAQHQKLIMAIAGAESSFWHILRLDPNLMVTHPEVKFAKHLGAMQAIKKLFNSGKRILVLDGLAVQGTPVNAHAETAICLFHKQYRRAIWGLTGLDKTKV